MSDVRDVTEWFRIIQDDKDDLKLARRVIDDLLFNRAKDRNRDLQQLINLFTAIRLDQMAKENHHGT